MPVTRSSSTIIRIRIGSGLHNLFKDSSPFRDRANCAIKVCHDVERALYETIMTSHVYHGERRSASMIALFWLCKLLVVVYL